MATQITLEGLPLEILASIFELLPLSDIVRGGYVSRTTRKAIGLTLADRYRAAPNKQALRAGALVRAGRDGYRDIRWIRVATELHPDSEMHTLMQNLKSREANTALAHLKEYPSLVQGYATTPDRFWSTPVSTFRLYAKKFTDINLRATIELVMSIGDFEMYARYAEVLCSEWIARELDAGKIIEPILECIDTNPAETSYGYFLAKCPSASYANNLAALLGVLRDPNRMLARDGDLYWDVIDQRDVLMNGLTKGDVLDWAIDVAKHVILTERSNRYREKLLLAWMDHEMLGRPKCDELRTDPRFLVDYNDLWDSVSDYYVESPEKLIRFATVVPDGTELNDNVCINWFTYGSLITHNNDNVVQALVNAGVGLPPVEDFGDFLDFCVEDETLPSPEAFLRMFDLFWGPEEEEKVTLENIPELHICKKLRDIVTRANERGEYDAVLQRMIKLRFI